MTAMAQGVILKALSGFYYVHTQDGTVVCRARGKHRHSGVSPLVGDRVSFTPLEDGKGALDEILPRVNEFSRPAVANVDQLVLVVSEAIPATDPFLIDRMTALAARQNCACVICVNKCDLAPGEELCRIYTAAGFPALRVSALTGEGIDALRAHLAGKVSVFTGNSGVGKSSLLNALSPRFALTTGEVSEKLGRGRHTTRHVELFALDQNTLIADTPGFSAFDALPDEAVSKQELADCFPDFRPYLGKCRFPNCAHIKEQGCAVLAAAARGEIEPTRLKSYARLYEQAAAIPEWKH